VANGQQGQVYPAALERPRLGPISRLPVRDSHRARIGPPQLRRKKVTEANVRALANWAPKSVAHRGNSLCLSLGSFSRIFTGVPLLVDLAAMRSAAGTWARILRSSNRSCRSIWVVDHSVQVDFAGSSDALRLNMQMEFSATASVTSFLNGERQAFDRL